MKKYKKHEIYPGGLCPVKSEWEYDDNNPDMHNFINDYEEESYGFFSSSGKNKIGLHCKKCGLTIKYYN